MKKRPLKVKKIIFGVAVSFFLTILFVAVIVNIGNSSILSTQARADSFTNDTNNKNSTAQTVEEKSAFEKHLKPIFTTPDRLKIQTLGIDIKLVKVGVDSTGKMETPQNWNEGGWYKRAAKPGELGNIIINAHYNQTNGAPAAFWELKNINVDDTVTLVDDYGREYAYKVTDSFYVDIQDPDRLEVLNDVEGKSELTLITCGGVWQPAFGTYNNRLVVKAELIS